MLLLTAVACLILFAWYPHPFQQFTDSGKFSLLLIVSACVAGPAMTWVVYKKGNWGLKFDLIVIVIIQLAALAWGLQAVYQTRPFYMVFTVDRFEVLSMRDVDPDSISNPEFINKPFSSPVLLYANMPKAGPAFQKLLREVAFEGKPDLQYRPEFWSLYEEKRQLAVAVSHPLAELRKARPESVSEIDELVKNNGADIAALHYVPAMLPNGEFAAILDANSGELIDTLVIDPWVN
jgi:hypothetical protein